jgi:hypothetical protein
LRIELVIGDWVIYWVIEDLLVIEPARSTRVPVSRFCVFEADELMQVLRTAATTGPPAGA